MPELLPPGRYLARPTNWKLEKTADGEPKINVQFEVGGKAVYWNGYFDQEVRAGRTKSALDVCSEALLAMGYKSDDLTDLADPSKHAIDTSKEVRITVEHYTKKNGDTGVKVQWVNPIESMGSSSQAMTTTEAKGLKKLNVAFKAKRKELGVPTPTKDDLDEIPF